MISALIGNTTEPVVEQALLLIDEAGRKTADLESERRVEIADVPYEVEARVAERLLLGDHVDLPELLADLLHGQRGGDAGQFADLATELPHGRFVGRRALDREIDRRAALRREFALEGV
jgi:hypothetical protein